MEDCIKFGDCLRELLTARGWSTTRLSKELNIDPSYVRKWINGERVPSLNSSYVDKISSALCSGVDREHANKIPEEMIKSLNRLGTVCESHKPLYAIVEGSLTKALIYSLSLDKDLRKNNSTKTRKSSFIDLLGKQEGKADLVEAPINQAPDKYEFNSIPYAIKGRESILTAAISLLQAAIEDNNIGEIVITFFGEKDVFEGHYEHSNRWNILIEQALEKGWYVKHLCRLSKNLERSFSLIRKIADWNGYQGSYDIYYHKKYGVDSPPLEIISIEGKGALLCFASENRNEIDRALFLDQKDSSDIICGYTSQITDSFAPLAELIGEEEYYELNVEKGKRSGNHYVCTFDFDFLTMPYELLERFLNISISDDNERLKHLNRIRKCLDQFNEDIKLFKEHHIVPMRSIEHFVKHGDYYFKNGYYDPTKEDMAVHLKNIIHLLKSYDKFEIALAGESDMHLLSDIHWDVKGDHTLVITIMPKSSKARTPVALKITEGTLIYAFQEYFQDIWDRITPKHREKEFVISWFEDLLSRYSG